MAYPESLAFVPGFIELGLEVVFCLIEGLLHLVVGLLQHAVLVDQCLGALAELAFVVADDFLVLLELLLGQLGIQLDVLDVLLLGPKCLHRLQHRLPRLHDLLDAAPAQPLCLLARLEVGVEVRTGE